IRQLESRANRARRGRRALVEALAKIQDEMPDGIGRIAAVAENLLVGVVALDDLVLLEGEQQLEERRRRNREPLDRFAQRDHDRMARLAVVAGEQLLAPPLQEVEGLLPAARLVAQIVGPAAVGVNVMK